MKIRGNIYYSLAVSGANKQFLFKTNCRGYVAVFGFLEFSTAHLYIIIGYDKSINSSNFRLPSKSHACNSKEILLRVLLLVCTVKTKDKTKYCKALIASFCFSQINEIQCSVHDIANCD
ncbi:hypothetical protein EDC96DRAFT_564116 [Choanephora cucurbitarum]|nr:hypothetical protein EDC96DRAFT_564116 [Choanephora cucurbitarum]